MLVSPGRELVYRSGALVFMSGAPVFVAAAKGPPTDALGSVASLVCVHESPGTITESPFLAIYREQTETCL